MTVWPSLALLLLVQRTVSPTWTVIVLGVKAKAENWAPTIETEDDLAATREDARTGRSAGTPGVAAPPSAPSGVAPAGAVPGLGG